MAIKHKDHPQKEVVITSANQDPRDNWIYCSYHFVGEEGTNHIAPLIDLRGTKEGFSEVMSAADNFFPMRSERHTIPARSL